MKLIFKIFVSIFFLLFLINCKKHNPKNFTLITSGYGGTYPGLIADPAKGRTYNMVAAKWGIDFIGEDV